MARKSTFVKGSTTFICTCCGHNTRWTGEQGTDSKLCVPCWDLAGLENALSDMDEAEFVAQGYGDEVKTRMAEIRKRSLVEFEKAKVSFDSLTEYFITDEEADSIANVLAPVAVANDHSHATKPVEVCRILRAERPNLTRKEFIAEAGARGVCKATAATQFHRLAK